MDKKKKQNLLSLVLIILVLIIFVLSIGRMIYQFGEESVFGEPFNPYEQICSGEKALYVTGEPLDSYAKYGMYNEEGNLVDGACYSEFSHVKYLTYCCEYGQYENEYDDAMNANFRFYRGWNPWSSNSKIKIYDCGNFLMKGTGNNNFDGYIYDVSIYYYQEEEYTKKYDIPIKQWTGKITNFYIANETKCQDVGTYFT